MAIARGLATVVDVQNINFFRDYVANDANNVKPGTSEIEAAIDFTIDDINVVLITVGYTLPLVLADSPYGYNYVKYWNALAAAERVERQHGTESIADNHLERLDQMKEDILNRVVILVDVPGAPTDAELSDSGTSELTSAGAAREPFFLRVQKF